jgi:hypothetical protein
MGARSHNDYHIPSDCTFDNNSHIPNNEDNRNNLYNRQSPKTTDPNMKDTHIHNPMPNWKTNKDNSTKNQYYYVAANFHFHQYTEYRFVENTALPLYRKIPLLSPVRIEYNNPERGIPPSLKVLRARVNKISFPY